MKFIRDVVSVKVVDLRVAFASSFILLMRGSYWPLTVLPCPKQDFICIARKMSR